MNRIISAICASALLVTAATPVMATSIPHDDDPLPRTPDEQVICDGMIAIGGECRPVRDPCLWADDCGDEPRECWWAADPDVVRERCVDPCDADVAVERCIDPGIDDDRFDD